MARHTDLTDRALLPHLEALLAQNCPAVRRKRPGPHNPCDSRTILIATNPAFGGGWEPAILKAGIEAAKQWRNAGLDYPLPIPKHAVRPVVDDILQQKPRDPIGTALRAIGKARNRITDLMVERDLLKAALPMLAKREISHIASLSNRLAHAKTDDDHSSLTRATLRRVALTLAAAFASAESDAPRTDPARRDGFWDTVDRLQRIEPGETDEQVAIAERLHDELDRLSGSCLPLDSADIQAISRALIAVIGSLRR